MECIVEWSGGNPQGADRRDVEGGENEGEEHDEG